MTELRSETINLLENFPEEKIFLVLQFIREKILQEKKSAWESEVAKKYENFN